MKTEDILRYAKIAKFAYRNDDPSEYYGNKCFWVKKENHEAVVIDFPNEIVVSIRGTEVDSFKDWITNFKFKGITPNLVVDMSYSPKKINSKIHEGFFKGGLAIFNEIIDYLDRCDKLITLVGHSAGGAKAISLSYIMRVLAMYLDAKIVTFGSPKAGNSYFNYVVTNNYICHRYTHKNDIVPYVPFFHGTHKHIDELRITDKNIVVNPNFINRLWGRMKALVRFKGMGFVNHSIDMYIKDLQNIIAIESKKNINE